MDDRAIARWRLHSLHLAGQSFASPQDVVTGVLAVQAENHPQASWAVAARTSGATEQELADAFDRGEVLRTHVLRPTWHYVRPDDIRWLIELTAPRIRRTFVQHQRQLDLDDARLEQSREIIVEALSGGVHLTRSQLGERLGAAGLPNTGRAVGVLMADAELSALVCSGAMQGTEHTYGLLDERAPRARRLDRDEAVAELVLRYFTGHGPATERDLAYWATMTLTDVRAGLAEVADRLEHIELAGRTYWYGQPPPDAQELEPRGHLLQILDEYHNGYQDSRGVLDVDGIVPPGRAANVGMVLVDGQMVGGMRRTLAAGHVTFEANLFRDLDDSEHAALQDAADRYGQFLGLEGRWSPAT